MMYQSAPKSPGSARTIHRVLPPSGSSKAATATKEMPSLVGVWKSQLHESACATCPHSQCKLSFLSLAGISSHYSACKGLTNREEYTVCGVCERRFRTFKSLQTHQEKAHYGVMQNQIRPSLSPTRNQQKVIVLQPESPFERVTLPPPTLSSSKNDDGIEDLSSETPEMKRSRILAESRLISSARKAGRPQIQPRQHSGTINMGDAAVKVIEGQILNTEGNGMVLIASPRHTYSSSHRNRRDLSEVVTPQVSSQSSDQDEDDLEAKERALDEDEAKLAEYEKMVQQSEEMAKEARRAKVKERLMKIEMKKKELERRLANAVQTLEESKSQDEEEDDLSEVGEEAPKEILERDHDQISQISDGHQEQQEPITDETVTYTVTVPISSGQSDDFQVAIPDTATKMQIDDEENTIVIETNDILCLSQGQVNNSDENENQMESVLISNVSTNDDSEQKDESPEMSCPRKDAVESSLLTDEESTVGRDHDQSEPDPPPVKRGPGRPPKKRGRGRPPKNNIPKSNVLEEAPKSRGVRRKHDGSSSVTLREKPVHEEQIVAASSDMKLTASDEVPEPAPKKRRGRRSKAELMKEREELQRQRDLEEAKRKEEEALWEKEQEKLVQEGGRRKRRAAKAASDKVQATISTLKSKADSDDEDIEKDEDSDDDALVDLKFADHFKVVKMGPTEKYKCIHCDTSFNTKTLVSNHVLKEHIESVKNTEVDDDDEEFAEDDEDIDEADDIVTDDEEEEDDDDNFDGKHTKRSKGRTVALFKRTSGQILPGQDYLKQEATFVAQNYNQNLFEAFHTTKSDWSLLKKNEVGKVMSSFKTQIKVNGSQVLAFEGQKCSTKKENHVFFAGGPITASAWCSGSEIPTLAISTRSSGQDQKSLIQVWQMTEDDAKPLRMVLAMVHDFGHVSEVAWAPSGNESKGVKTSQLARLGVLAVACQDECIRLLSVCQPKELTSKSNWVKANAVMTLKMRPQSAKDTCTAISWSRSLKHRVIAGGFTNGVVALWDLLQCDKSPFRDGSILYPYKKILAHTFPITSVDLKPTSLQEYPQFMATAAGDRHVAIWDLHRSFKPLRSTKRTLVTTVSWLAHHSNHVIASSDDVFTFGCTRTLMVEFGKDKPIYTPIMCQNSAIHKHSYNVWANSILSGTNGGELILMLVPTIGFSLDRRVLAPRRIFIQRASTVANGEGITLEDFALTEVTIKDKSSEKRMVPTDPDSMSAEDVTEEPLTTITAVSHHPDASKANLVFCGDEAGLGRVINVEFLRDIAKR